MCVLFFPAHFFQAFESRRLTRVMSEPCWLCVRADEKGAVCSDPALLWGVRDKAPHGKRPRDPEISEDRQPRSAGAPRLLGMLFYYA